MCSRVGPMDGGPQGPIGLLVVSRAATAELANTLVYHRFEPRVCGNSSKLMAETKKDMKGNISNAHLMSRSVRGSGIRYLESATVR